MSINRLSLRNHPITFQAQWHENNKQLAETFLEKVTRIAFCWLNKLVARLVLPATEINQNQIERVKEIFNQKWTRQLQESRFLAENFIPFPIEVTTPDGAILRGTFFKNAIASETAPTVIFFQPNAMISKQGAFDWVLKQAALQGFSYNFIYFDYRGCAESEGTAYSKKNLILDGESIYQFVRNQLHVPANDIHFYGWSLGAAIGANVKKIYHKNKSRYINDRSFNSIGNVVKNFLPDYSKRTSCINKTIKIFLSSSILPFIVSFWASLLNWNIESAKAIGTLQGKTLIVHHPEDELMKKEASLYHSLFQRAIAPPKNIQELNLNRCLDYPFFIHGAPIFAFTNHDFDPEYEISKFLFSSNCCFSDRMLNRFAMANQEFRNKVFAMIALDFQNGGFYWGSGEDAFYNRNGVSMNDELRVQAIVKTKLTGLS